MASMRTLFIARKSAASLPFVVKPLVREWEEPLGLLQRAAVQRRLAGTRILARRLGILLTVLPTKEQVERLEREFGAPAGSIAAKAVCAAGHGLAAIGGETFAVASSVRTIRHVCPSCLTADRANGGLEDDVAVRPWIRSFWGLAAVTCCPTHVERLTARCDCGAQLAGLHGRIDRCAAGHLIEPRVASVSADEVEAVRYIMARLDGSRAPGGELVVDGMTWPQAAKTILRFGLFKLHGREPPGLNGSLPVEVAGEAMGVGYRELKRFPRSFEELLDELSSPAQRKAGGPGGKYGNRFYGYMQRDGEGHLEPLRAVFEWHAGLADEDRVGASRSQDTRRLWETPLDADEVRRLRRRARLPPGTGRLTRREALDLCCESACNVDPVRG